MPDQIVDLGYESTNPLLNLGSLFLTILFYGVCVLTTFLILWPLKVMWVSTTAFEYMMNRLFFNSFFNIFFNAYFAFLYCSILSINSEPNDKYHHDKLIIFSWVMTSICLSLIPSIVLFAASRSNE